MPVRTPLDVDGPLSISTPNFIWEGYVQPATLVIERSAAVGRGDIASMVQLRLMKLIALGEGRCQLYLLKPDSCRPDFDIWLSECFTVR